MVLFQADTAVDSRATITSLKTCRLNEFYNIGLSRNLACYLETMNFGMARNNLIHVDVLSHYTLEAD